MIGNEVRVVVPRPLKKLDASQPRTLSSLIKEWLSAQFIGKRLNTRLSAERALLMFERWVGAKPIFEPGRIVSLPIYADWVRYSYDRWKPSTAGMYTILVNRFLRWCRLVGYITNEPWAYVRRPRGRKAEVLIITEQEYRAMLGCESPAWMKWLLMCGWWTGLSLGDACTLEWKHVNLEGPNMEIQRTRMKTGALSSIPIIAGSEFHRALLDRVDVRSPHWPNNPEKGIWFVEPYLAKMWFPFDGSRGCKAIRYHWCRLRARVGMDSRKRFHNFRGRLASSLSNSGAHPAVAMSVLGHTSMDSIAPYYKSNPQARNLAMCKMLETEKRLAELGAAPVHALIGDADPKDDGSEY